MPGLEPPWWLQEALAAEVSGASGVGAGPVQPDAIAAESEAGAGAGSHPARGAQPLSRDAEVDVAIVGGGYTGLWTALALRERDPSLSIAVLEKEIVGWGPSGRNGGFLHGYWAHLARLCPLIGEAPSLELCRISDRIVPAVRARKATSAPSAMNWRTRARPRPAVPPVIATRRRCGSVKLSGM